MAPLALPGLLDHQVATVNLVLPGPQVLQVPQVPWDWPDRQGRRVPLALQARPGLQAVLDQLDRRPQRLWVLQRPCMAIAGYGFSAYSSGDRGGIALNFPIALPEAPLSVAFRGDPECPVSGAPQAGTLCLTMAHMANVAAVSTSSMEASGTLSTIRTADAAGFFLQLIASAPGAVLWTGTYDYRAP